MKCKIRLLFSNFSKYTLISEGIFEPTWGANPHESLCGLAILILMRQFKNAQEPQWYSGMEHFSHSPFQVMKQPWVGGL